MFKVGDSVRVVNAHGSVRMKEGDVRTVKAIVREYGISYVTFVEHVGKYSLDRFELIPKPVPAEGVAQQNVVRLRVIEGMRPHLRVGDIVTVKKENEKSYLLNEHPGKLWAKRRFEIVADVPVPVEAKFKKGDEVRLKKDCKGQYWYVRKAGVYIVREVREKGFWFENINGVYQYPFHDFELVNAPAPKQAPKKVAGVFAPGDKVFSDKAAHNGKFEAGEVLIVKSFNGVFFDFEDPKKLGMGGWRYNKDGLNEFGYNFQHYEEKAKAPRELKVGDKVVAVATKKSFARFGPSEHMEVAVKKKAVMTVKEVDWMGVKGQIRMEILVGDGIQLHWFSRWDVSELVHADEVLIAGNVVKEEQKQAVPPKPALGCIYEEAAKQEKAGAIGKDLCSWVVQNKGADKYQHQNWPCYAGLQGDVHSKVEQCLISMKNAKRYIHTVKEQEMYDDWLKYVVEESPFKSAFLTKTAEEAKEKGLLLDCSRPRVECLTSATAMRDGYEHSSRLPIFTHFIEEGYSKHTAYLLSYMLTEHDGSWNMSGMTNGHTNMDGSQDIQQIFKFFREGYHNDSWKAQPAWNSGKEGNGGMYVYIAEASKDSMRAFVQSFGKKSGTGWQERYSFDEKCVKKLADAIEANIVK